MMWQQADICADEGFPMEPYFCLFFPKGKNEPSDSVMPRYDIAGWGRSNSACPLDNDSKNLSTVEAAWLSLVERQFYYCKISIEDALASLPQLIKAREYNNILLGFAPRGKLALWLFNDKSSYLASYKQGEKFEMSIPEYLEYDCNCIMDEYCRHRLTNFSLPVEPTTDELNHFDDRIKRYRYKFRVIFEEDKKQENPIDINSSNTATHNRGSQISQVGEGVQKEKSYKLKALKVSFFDGSFDKENDGWLEREGDKAIPQKITVEFSQGKVFWEVHFWLDSSILSFFRHFYGAHPETKSDFILKIDPGNNKYELSMYRQGLKQPIEIPQQSHQLIVFKSKFEHYRSQNYNQPRGSWIW